MTKTYKSSQAREVKYEGLSLDELLSRATETIVELEAIMILHFGFSEKARQLFRYTECFLERTIENKAGHPVTNSQFESLTKCYLDL